MATPAASPPGPQIAPPLRHVAAGHAMRGIGALMVFVAHVPGTELTLQLTGMPDPARRDVFGLFGGPMSTYTIFGASMILNGFFVLSAYLLGRQFLAWALGAWPRPSVWRYAVRRVLRIFPPFLAVVAGVLLVTGREGAPWSGVLHVVSLVDQVLTRPGPFYERLSHTWTVSIELWFYVLLPIIVAGLALAARRWRWRGIVGGLVVVSAVAIAVQWIPIHPAPFPLTQIWRFVPGLWLAAAELHPPTRARLAVLLRGRRPLALAALGLALLWGSASLQALRVIHPEDYGTGIDLLGVAWTTTVVLGAGLFILGLLAPEWAGRRPLLHADARWLQALGDRSYAFYLVHFPVLLWLQAHVALGHRGYLGLGLVAVVGLAVSFTLTELLHRLVERPSLRLGAWVTRHRTDPDAVYGDAGGGGEAVGRPGTDAAGPPAGAIAAPGRLVPRLVPDPASAARPDPTPRPALDPDPASAARPDPTPRPTAARLREFAGGDAIRGYASLAVFSWHAFGIAILLRGRLDSPLYTVHELGPVLAWLPHLAIAGLLGFFALSAYLISRPFVAAAVRGTRPPRAGRYVLRRILRIHPLFVLVLTAVVLLYGTGDTGLRFYVETAALVRPLGGAVFPGGYDHVGHAWSLHVEFAMYLLVPAVVLVLIRAMAVVRVTAVPRRAAVLVVVAVLAALVSAYVGRHSDLPRLVGPAVAVFVPGVLLAIADAAGWLDRGAARYGRAGAATALAAGVVVTLSAWPLATVVGAAGWGPGVSIYGTSLGVGLLVLAALLAERATGRAPAVLRVRWVDAVGRISYPLYLVHVPIQLAVVHWLLDHHDGGGYVTIGALTWALTLLPSLALALLLHRVVELPAIGLGARLGSTRGAAGRGGDGPATTGPALELMPPLREPAPRSATPPASS